MINHMSIVDKRYRKRHHFDQSILCFNYIEEASFETRFTALRIIVKDISYGGIGAVCDKKLEVGDILVFNMTTPTSKREIMAQVKWRAFNQKMFNVGLEFYQLKRDDLMLIHEIIVRLEKLSRK